MRNLVPLFLFLFCACSLPAQDTESVVTTETLTKGIFTYIVVDTNQDGTGLKINESLFSDTDTIQDADGDTMVQVEESADEDIIRFDAGGTQYATIDLNGLNIEDIIATDSDGLILSESTGDERLIVDTNLIYQSRSSASAVFNINTYDDSTAFSQLIFTKSDTDTVGTEATTEAGDTLGHILFKGINGNGAATTAAYIDVTQAAADGGDPPSLTTVRGEMKFYTATLGGTNTNQLFLDKDGYVGIGGDPAVELDVTGAAHISDDLIVYEDFSFDSGSTVSVILDEDAMGSDSATALATQQSVKAYVDAAALGVAAGTDDYLARFTGSGVEDSGIFDESDAIAIRINSDEELGLGAVAVSGYKLRLANNDHIKQAIEAYSSTVTDHAQLVFSKSASNTIGTDAATGVSDVFGTIYFYGVDNNSVASQGGYIRARQTGAVGANNVPTAIDAYVTDSVGASETFTFHPAGFGVNQSTPTAALDVDGDAIFNDSGADKDFRVEGVGWANALFVNGANGRVGVMTGAPTSSFETSGTVTISGAGNLRLENGEFVSWKDNGGSYRSAITLDSGDDLAVGGTTVDDVILRVGTVGDAVWVQDTTGYMGVGVDPNFRIEAYSDEAKAIAKFFNDGNNINREGVIIQCGTDDALTTDVFIIIKDGDGDELGSVIHADGTVQIAQASGIAQQVFDGVTTVTRTIKEDITATTLDTKDMINRIAVYDYTLKGNGQRVRGQFTADQLAEVYPGAVYERTYTKELDTGTMVTVNGEDAWVWDTEQITQKMVMPIKLIPVLVNTVQEQGKRIDELEKKAEEQQEAFDDLEARLEFMERSVFTGAELRQTYK